MIEWGQKSKPPKIPGPKIYLPPHPPTKKKTVKKNFHAEFPSLKNFQKALNDKMEKQVLLLLCVLLQKYVARICSHYMNLQIVLNIPKTP